MNKFFKTFRNPLISAIVTFVIALLSVSGILYQRNTIQLQQRHDEIDNAANTLREKIETIFSEVHAAANAISIFTTEKRPNEGFDSLAKNIFYFIQSIDDLRLVEGEIITHSYSKDGQVPVNIIGHNIFSDSLLNKEVAITLKYKDLYFAGPLNLLQGGKGFVGRLPIYHGDKYYGFGVVTIKMATFLNAIGLNENRDDKFIYQLSKVNVNTGIEEFFLPYGKKFNNKETVVINLPNANFNIYTTLPNINFFYTYWVIILFALLISFSVAYFAWFVANKPKRMQMTIDESMKMIRLGEAKYKSLFKHAFESIFILNTRGNIVEVNDSFSNLIGYSQQELLKMTIEDLILEQDVKNIPLNDQLVKKDDSIIRNRKLKTKDDKIVELQISKTVMGDSRILCIGRDVTEFNEIQKLINEVKI
ncbi:MAG: PAS domain S-box protein [Ferruginibacter sp.]